MGRTPKQFADKVNPKSEVLSCGGRLSGSVVKFFLSLSFRSKTTSYIMNIYPDCPL